MSIAVFDITLNERERRFPDNHTLKPASFCKYGTSPRRARAERAGSREVIRGSASNLMLATAWRQSLPRKRLGKRASVVSWRTSRRNSDGKAGSSLVIFLA